MSKNISLNIDGHEFDIMWEDNGITLEELISYLRRENFISNKFKQVSFIVPKPEKVVFDKKTVSILDTNRGLISQINDNSIVKIVSLSYEEVFLILEFLPSAQSIYYCCDRSTTLNHLKHEITKGYPNLFGGQTYLKDLLNIDIKRFDSRYYDSRFSNGKHTLKDLDIQDGERLLVTPRLVAGGHGTLVLHYFDKLILNEPHSFILTIFNNDRFFGGWLKRNKQIEGSKVETSKVMSVEMTENSIKPKLDIKAISDPQQSTKGYSTAWRFELIPKKLGITSLIIKINIHNNIFGFGEVKKSVLIIDKQIEVKTQSPEIVLESMSVENLTLEGWDKQKKTELILKVADNKTGEVLCDLVQLLHNHQNDIFNQIITLQAHWNEAMHIPDESVPLNPGESVRVIPGESVPPASQVKGLYSGPTCTP